LVSGYREGKTRIRIGTYEGRVIEMVEVIREV
jgi:hypothetical protein